MQTLFDSSKWRREERGPFPFAELIFCLALVAALCYWFAGRGTGPDWAAWAGTISALFVTLGIVIRWRSGTAWGTRMKPGPFPWPKFLKGQVKGVLLIGLLAVSRLPTSLIELVAAFAFVGVDGLWVGKWLWANSRRGAQEPKGQARG